MTVIIFSIFFSVLFFLRVKADATIAFGSCGKQYLPQKFWTKSILTRSPDLWLWLGDAIYPSNSLCPRFMFSADCSSISCIREAYNMIEKEQKDYVKFRSLVPVIDGTWDDHDYGLNDAGSNFRYKNESKIEFLKFIQKESRQTVYTSRLLSLDKKTTALAKIIMLDTRFFRDTRLVHRAGELQFKGASLIAAALRGFTALSGIFKTSNDDLLGERQWSWFERELKSSTENPNIKFNVIVSSIQILTDIPFTESWGHFPKSQSRLFSLLQNYKPQGVIFISGDVHFAEILGHSKCVQELTSSGLTHSMGRSRLYSPILRYGIFPFWRHTKLYLFENFGLLRFQCDNDQCRVEGELVGLPTNKVLESYASSHCQHQSHNHSGQYDYWSSSYWGYFLQNVEAATNRLRIFCFDSGAQNTVPDKICEMVKQESYTKGELIQILTNATTSRERNRAAKLLKKFEANPKTDLDSEANAKTLKPKQCFNLQAFVCYRCDKVKQTKIKVTWSTSRGNKTICNACYNVLQSHNELDYANKILARAAAGLPIDGGRRTRA